MVTRDSTPKQKSHGRDSQQKLVNARQLRIEQMLPHSAIHSGLAAAKTAARNHIQQRARIAAMRRAHLASLKERGKTWEPGRLLVLDDIIAEIDRRFDDDPEADTLAQRIAADEQAGATSEWTTVCRAVARSGIPARSLRFVLPVRILLWLLQAATVAVGALGVAYLVGSLGAWWFNPSDNYLMQPLHSYFLDWRDSQLRYIQMAGIPAQYAAWTPLGALAVFSVINQCEPAAGRGWLSKSDWRALIITVGRYRADEHGCRDKHADSAPRHGAESPPISTGEASKLQHTKPVLGTIAPAVEDLDRKRRERSHRISGVREALTQLDSDWLAYEIDTEAYYLTKPVLRDVQVPQTRAYRDALYQLRELGDALTDNATDQQIIAAEMAADRALAAWDDANDHALAVGVNDRSPVEQRALRRLHALVGQLTAPSTPDAMWPQLIDAIDAQMAKLKTVPVTWSHIAQLPAIESTSRLRALQLRPATDA